MKTSGQNHLKLPIITYLMCVIQLNGAVLTITGNPPHPNVSTLASLTCHIQSFNGGAQWIKNASSLTQCIVGSCFPSASGDLRYRYSANATTMTVTIPSLDIAKDDGTWTCAFNAGADTKHYYLTVYDPPKNMSINGFTSSAVYDGVTVHLSVITGCIHPSSPEHYNITWKYAEALSAEESIFGTIIAQNVSSGGSCPNTYEGSLVFNLYLTNKMNTGNTTMYISQIKMTFTMPGINVPVTLNVAYNVTPNGTVAPSSPDKAKIDDDNITTQLVGGLLGGVATVGAGAVGGKLIYNHYKKRTRNRKATAEDGSGENSDSEKEKENNDHEKETVTDNATDSKKQNNESSTKSKESETK